MGQLEFLDMLSAPLVIRSVSASRLGLDRAIRGRADFGCRGAGPCGRATWRDISATGKKTECAESEN